MAVGAPATKLHLSTAAARRPLLLHLAGVAVLCSVSYLLGIWHNGGFSAVPSGGAASSVSIATAASVSCVSPTPNILGGGGGSSSSSSAPLEFSQIDIFSNILCLCSDKLVEQAVGMPSVAQIFKVHSESFFRDNESSVLRDLSSMRRLVVATGGGAVIRPVNWKYMKKGLSVWLDVPLEALARRIAGKSKKEQD